MLEPATTLTPCGQSCKNALSYENPCSGCPMKKDNFLQKAQTVCRANGALFILDEMITGFRWHLNGAQTYFGVEPDLSTFGKGMANGFSVAALVGRREIMDFGSISNLAIFLE
jgi:glutamate-1-semialdehyde 2,1-aminomutase